VLKTIETYLEANELMKIRVLETAASSASEMCSQVCEVTEASPVQVIGARFVVFRRSSKPENRKIAL
jgi:RNA-binding protein